MFNAIEKHVSYVFFCDAITDKTSVLHECFVAHLHIADIYIFVSLLSCQSSLNCDDFLILATFFFMLSKQNKYSHGAHAKNLRKLPKDIKGKLPFAWHYSENSRRKQKKK